MGGDTHQKQQRGGGGGARSERRRWTTKTTDLPAVCERQRERQTETERESQPAKDSASSRGDSNDPKILVFHSVKQRKVRGRSTSPEGRAVLHQAVDESFVCGQEHRCA